MKRALTCQFTLVCAGLLAASASANPRLVNCGRGDSLAGALRSANPNDTLVLIGRCTGGVTITDDGITLDGRGLAIIDGAGQDGVTIDGAARVVLKGLQVTNAASGVVAKRGAHVALTQVNAHDNGVYGILVEFASSADLADCTVQRNGVNGLDLEGGAAVSVTGGLQALDHSRGFGVFINSTSTVTFTGASLTARGNIIGVQVGNGSSAFLAGPTTSLTLTQNVSDGLTIVSNSHLFVFGSKIESFLNGFNGISAFSKSGLDADAAATILAHDNAFDGIHFEETSLLNLFNTPAFSGVPGVTAVTTAANGHDGISAAVLSVVHLFNQTAIDSHGNGRSGLSVDDGSSAVIIQSSLRGNPTDVILSFGSRGDFNRNTIGTLSCDKSGLIRGDTAFVCQ